MIEKFFSNVAADRECEENLRRHIEAAYAATLKQYHSWFIQKTFSVRFEVFVIFSNIFWLFIGTEIRAPLFPFQLIYTVLPSRSQLIGRGATHHENIEALKQFLESMRLHLLEINLMICDWFSIFIVFSQLIYWSRSKIQWNRPLHLSMGCHIIFSINFFTEFCYCARLMFEYEIVVPLIGSFFSWHRNQW